MRAQIQRFLQDSSGVTALEYALLAGLIATVIVTAVTLMGGEVAKLFEYVKDQVKQAIS